MNIQKQFEKKRKEWKKTLALFRTHKIVHHTLCVALVALVWAVYGVLYWENRSFEKWKPFIPQVQTAYDEDLKSDIKDLVAGTPMEKMVPYIIRQDRAVAAYLVAIAKKESNWGRRAPVSDGEDCYNYWGIRFSGNTAGSGGHSCFSTPREAVAKTSERIRELVYTEGRDRPEEMRVWKCGYSCASHSPQSVKKWVSDVSYYYEKIIQRGT